MIFVVKLFCMGIFVMILSAIGYVFVKDESP